MADSTSPQPHPGSLGFRMPSEWHPHAATLMAWPHNAETWPGNLAAAQAEFLQLAQTIARDEPVILLVPPNVETAAGIPEPSAGHDTGIRTFPMATNDAWIRDYGPTILVNESNWMAVDWQYNAWGNKYPPFDDDQRVARQVAGSLSFGWNSSKAEAANPCAARYFESSLHLEGGAIDVDGSGLLLCTESCALNDNRNPGWSREQVEQEIRSCTGTREIIWLPGMGITGDDTDGHIDQLARFLPDNRIAYAWTDRETDPAFKHLARNRKQLQDQLERVGQQFELLPLQLPQPASYNDRVLPRSYCNFYITNQSVIVPQFDCPEDSLALETLAHCLTDRKVIGCPSVELITGLGSFHCLTQQIPMTNFDP